MKQKSIAIVAILSATILTAVPTTAQPFNMKDAEGQIIIPTPGRTHYLQAKTEQNKILFVVDSHIHVDDTLE